MSTHAAFKTEAHPMTEPSVLKSIYTLQVTLLSGPVSEAFAEENPEVSRTIQIRGDQTLEDLHDIIFTAFDREDDNMYEFRIGNSALDKEERCYVLPSEFNPKPTNQMVVAGDVTRTRIDTLNLSMNESFTYWFDFSDDWIHRIIVLEIDDTIPQGKYPRIIARIYESPSQYPDFEDEENMAEESSEVTALTELEKP